MPPLQRKVTITLDRADTPSSSKETSVTVDMSIQDRESIKQAAFAMGLSMAQFIRLTAIISARRVAEGAS